MSELLAFFDATVYVHLIVVAFLAQELQLAFKDASSGNASHSISHTRPLHLPLFRLEIGGFFGTPHAT